MLLLQPAIVAQPLLLPLDALHDEFVEKWPANSGRGCCSLAPENPIERHTQPILPLYARCLRLLKLTAPALRQLVLQLKPVRVLFFTLGLQSVNQRLLHSTGIGNGVVCVCRCAP